MGIPYISEDEYRESEELLVEMHEWFQGELFPMPAGTFSHAVICGNICAATLQALRGKAPVPLNGGMRIKVESTGLHTYSDGVIFCPPGRFEGRGDNTLLTPQVIFEVSTCLTETYDRTDKFHSYTQIETLTDYVLVESERVSVEHFERLESGWLRRFYGTRNEALTFRGLDINLPLSDIYDDLDLPENAEAPLIRLRSEA